MKLKNLGYILLKSVWVSFSLIPLPVMYVLSDILYFPFYYCIRYRRKVVRKNLQESFPEKSTNEIVRIEKKFYHFLLDMFFEMNKCATISRKALKKRVVFKDFDKINALLNKGKNISLYLAHYANWEWISSLPLHLDNNNVKAGQIFHGIRNKAVDRLLYTNRSRMGAVSIEMHRTLRWINEQINNNTTTITGYIADQTGQPNDYYLNFLHHYVPAMVGAEKITKRYKMEAYYLDVTRVKRGYYEASFRCLAEDPGSLPNYQLTEIYYDHLEKTIRERPEFYLWSHRRFKRAKTL